MNFPSQLLVDSVQEFPHQFNEQRTIDPVVIVAKLKQHKNPLLLIAAIAAAFYLISKK